MINTTYDPLVRYMTDDKDADSLDSKSSENPEVEYHFDGFDIEINTKVALTPVNIKPQSNG